MKRLIIIKKNKILHFFIISFLLHCLLLCFIHFTLFKTIVVKENNNEFNSNIINGVMMDLDKYLKIIKQQKVYDNNHNDLLNKHNVNEAKKKIYIQNNQEWHDYNTKNIVKKQINLNKNKLISKNNNKLSKKNVSINKKKVKNKNDLKLFNKNKNHNIITVNTTKKITTSIESLLNNLSIKSLNNNTNINSISDKINKKKNYDNSNLTKYIAYVKNLIENKFYNASYYKGQVCVLNIKFNTNDIVVRLNNKYNINNKELCDTAMQLIKLISIPRPVDKNVFNIIQANGIDLLFNPSS